MLTFQSLQHCPHFMIHSFTKMILSCDQLGKVVVNNIFLCQVIQMTSKFNSEMGNVAKHLLIDKTSVFGNN